MDKNEVSTRACLPGQPGIQIPPGKQFKQITKITKYEVWKLYKLQNNLKKKKHMLFVLEVGMNFCIFGVLYNKLSF